MLTVHEHQDALPQLLAKMITMATACRRPSHSSLGRHDCRQFDQFDTESPLESIQSADIFDRDIGRGRRLGLDRKNESLRLQHVARHLPKFREAVSSLPPL